MSSFWAFITAIVCLAIIGQFVVRIVKVAKSGRSSSSGEQRFKELSEDIAGIEQDLEDARSRIEVLEKIVTDNKYHLDKEIRDLA